MKRFYLLLSIMHTNVYRNFDRREEEDGRMKKNINQMRMHFEHEDTTTLYTTLSVAVTVSSVQVH